MVYGISPIERETEQIWIDPRKCLMYFTNTKQDAFLFGISVHDR